MLVKYGEHPPVPPGAPCEACGITPPRAVTDHCHRHGWVRGVACVRCNSHMTLIDRGIAPSGGDLAALIAFARRCPDCPVVVAEELVPMAGRTAFTWRLTAERVRAFDDLALRLRRELHRPKLDKAEVLAALVSLAEENTAVFGVLVAWMQASDLGDTRTHDRSSPAG